jgi:hypothetical protein
MAKKDPIQYKGFTINYIGGEYRADAYANPQFTNTNLAKLKKEINQYLITESKKVHRSYKGGGGVDDSENAVSKFKSIENAVKYNRNKFNRMDGNDQKKYYDRINKKKTIYNLEYGDNSFISVSKKEYDKSYVPETADRNYYTTWTETSSYAEGGGITLDEIISDDSSDWSKIKKENVDWDNFDKLPKKEQDRIMKEIEKDLFKGRHGFADGGGIKGKYRISISENGKFIGEAKGDFNTMREVRKEYIILVLGDFKPPKYKVSVSIPSDRFRKVPTDSWYSEIKDIVGDNRVTKTLAEKWINKGSASYAEGGGVESKYVDVYMSIDKNTWESDEDKIMALSVDGIQSHEDSEMTLEEFGDYNINIRIERKDLDKVRGYADSIQEHSVMEDGNHYDNGGGINSYNPIKNRPVTYILKDKNGKEVFKTKSANKASDKRVTRFVKGEETSVLATDSKGNEKQLFKLQSEESKSYAEGGEISVGAKGTLKNRGKVYVRAFDINKGIDKVERGKYTFNVFDEGRIDTMNQNDFEKNFTQTKKGFYAEGGEVEGYNMDEVVKHFVMAGLWASNDDEGEPFEDSYDADDVSKESYEKIAKGAAKFINENKALLKKHNISTESLGHDLFLDSQGHGVGFWDRGYGDDGDTLSKSASKIFASDQPYVGDDKKIYFKKGGSIKSSWFSGELSFLNW